MNLMSLLFVAYSLCNYEVEAYPTDSIPQAQPDIKQRLEIFSQATGTKWEYNIAKVPGGKLLAMFCGKASAVHLRKRERLDSLINRIVEPFFEGFILQDELSAYEAIGFCLTESMDSCFERLPLSAIYTFHINPDITKPLDLAYRAGLCASLMGFNTKSQLILSDNQDYPGEIIFKIPIKHENIPGSQLEDDAQKWAKIAYLYLLKTKEAEVNEYRKINICYFNKNNPHDKAYYIYDKNNPLFTDLK